MCADYSESSSSRETRPRLSACTVACPRFSTPSFASTFRDVRLHRLVADVERRGDLPVGPSERELTEDVGFARRGIVDGAVADHGRCGSRIDDSLAARDRTHRREQRFRLGVLAHVAGRARAKRAHEARLVDRRRQRDDPCERRTRENAFRRLYAVNAAGQQQILQHDVRLPLIEMLEQLLAARGDADDGQIGKRFEVRLQTP